MLDQRRMTPVKTLTEADEGGKYSQGFPFAGIEFKNFRIFFLGVLFR